MKYFRETPIQVLDVVVKFGKRDVEARTRARDARDPRDPRYAVHHHGLTLLEVSVISPRSMACRKVQTSSFDSVIAEPPIVAPVASWLTPQPAVFPCALPPWRIGTHLTGEPQRPGHDGADEQERDEPRCFHG
jgi:hypothetical protein